MSPLPPAGAGREALLSRLWPVAEAMKITSFDPPITRQPGDLLMIFEMGVENLTKIRDNGVCGDEGVEEVALVLKKCLDHWLELRAKEKD